MDETVIQKEKGSNMTETRKSVATGGLVIAAILLASVAVGQPKNADPGTTAALTSKMDVSEKQATEGAGAVFALAESRMSPEKFWRADGSDA